MSDPTLDIVTTLQDSLDRLSSSLYSTAGALQRDARPASVRGEAIKPVARQIDSRELAEGWAAEVSDLSKAVEQLIHKLPDASSTEEEELARVAAAIDENNRVGEELRRETRITEQLLSDVRSVYAALADAELASRTQAQRQDDT